MGEPARNYQDDEAERYVPPTIRALEGGGETTARKEGHLRSVDEPDQESLKAAEAEGDSQTPSSKGESRELDQIGDGYRQEKGKRKVNLNFRSIASGGKKKWVVGGAGLGAIALVIFVFLIIGQLKAVHFSQILTASSYARLTQILNERTAQNTFDSAVADGNPAIRPGSPALWERLRRLDPTRELVRLGQEGRFKFDFEKERNAFKLRKTNNFQGVTVDGKSINLADITKSMYGSNSYYDLFDPRKKAAVRYEFTRQTQAAIAESFANESRFVRSAAAKSVMDNVGFKFNKWRQQGRNYIGLDPEKAFRNNLVETNEKVSTEAKPIKTGIGGVDEATEKLSDSDAINKYLEKNNNDPDLTKRVLATYAEHQKTAAKVADAASKAGQFTMLASMACMANISFKSIPEIDRNNQKQAEAFGLLGGATGSQIKYGHGSAEAIGAESKALDGAETSPSYQRAIGNENPEVPDNLTSSSIRSGTEPDSALYKAITAVTSPSNYVLPLGLGAIVPDSLTDPVDKKFCETLLSPSGMIGATVAEIGAQTVIGLFTAGTGTVATEAGAATAVKLFSAQVVRSSGQTIKGLGSKSSLKTIGAFTAYSFGLQALVSQLSGQTFGGLATGPTRAENQYTGMKANQNHMNRSVMYGAPMSVQDRKAADNEAQDIVRTAYTGGNPFDKYINTSNPYSTVSVAMMSMPSTADGVAAKAQKGVASIGSMFGVTKSIGSLFSRTALADSETDAPIDQEDKMQSWGFTLAEQKKMRTPEYGIEQNSAIVEPRLSELDAKYSVCYTTEDQYDADELVKTSPNCSKEALTTDEALRYRIYKGPDTYMVDDKEHGLDDETQANQGLSFAVTNLNVLHAVSFPDEKCNTSTEPKTGDYRPACVERRSKLQADYITGNLGSLKAEGGGSVAVPQMDIVGLQEVSIPQLTALKTNLPTYDVVPAQVPKFHGVGVMWNTAKFTKISEGNIKSINNVGQAADIPWVKLAASGQTYYAISIHAPNADNNGTPTNRRKMAQDIVDWARKIATESPGAMVIVTGDFNERLNEANGAKNNMYCTLTTGAFLQNTYDMAGGKDAAKPCPTDDGGKTSIDHIYASPLDNATASGWTKLASEGQVAQMTDHRPTYVNISLSGEGAGGSFRVATFNVLGAHHKAYLDRAKKSVKVINGAALEDGKSIDIVGLQEFEEVQRKYFAGELPNYGMYPKPSSNKAENAIMWDSTKFDLLQGSMQEGLVYFCGGLDAPMVLLQDKATKQKFYVLNTHDPANSGNNPCKSEAPKRRMENAEKHAALMTKLYSEGYPVIYTGDFNSGYQNNGSGSNIPYQNEDKNLTYCILTRTGVINDGYDVVNKRAVKCPNPKKKEDRANDAGGVDHVFMTKGIDATKYIKVKPGANGGDHPTHIFDVTLPGSKKSATDPEGAAGDPGDQSKLGFSWPVNKSDYLAINNCWEKPGHTGIDIPIKNKPVLAAADGVIVKTGGPKGDGGNYVIIKHDNGYWSNYQHLSKITKTSGKVTAGQQIGVSGNTGYVRGAGGGYHLHFSITKKEGLDSRFDVAYSLNPLNFLPKDGRNLGGCK